MDRTMTKLYHDKTLGNYIAVEEIVSDSEYVKFISCSYKFSSIALSRDELRELHKRLTEYLEGQADGG